MGVRGVRVDVNEELKVFLKIQKKLGGGGPGGSGWWGVRVDVNEKLKFFVKIEKKRGEVGGGGGGGGRVGGGQGRCERRIEVFVKNPKKN